MPPSRKRLETTAPATASKNSFGVRAHTRGGISANLSLTHLSVLAVLTFGVGLRVKQYLSNTSISLDESALALNLLHRSYSGLLQELDFNQGAPPGFLFLEKALVEIFGNSEFAFRALPLVAGVLSVLLYLPFARRLLPKGLPREIVGLIVFGSSATLVLYAATAKPYALDVVVTLGLYILAAELIEGPRIKWITALAVGGLIATWFSYAAVFVLAGIGSTLIVRSAARRRWREAATYALAPCVWLVSFAIVYLVSVKDLGHLHRSLSSDRSGSAEGALNTVKTAGGAVRSVLGIGEVDLGGHGLGKVAAVFAIALALIGLATLVQEMPVSAALLTTPAIYTLVAWRLGLYPFFTRTLLFLAPPLVALLAYGAVRSIAAQRVRILGGVGALIVMTSVVVPGMKTLFEPQPVVPLKPALRYLAAHQHSSDTLWVYQATQYGLRYYLECKCFGNATLVQRGTTLWPLRPAEGSPDQFSPALESTPPRFIVSRAVGDSTRYRHELRALTGRRRIWVLISDADAGIRAPLLSFLGHLGARRAVFRAGGEPTTAVVYLYDLGRRR